MPHIHRPLEASDTTTESKESTFRLMSKQKSFMLRAKSAAERDSWVEDITKAATKLQMKESGHACSESEMAPIWRSDSSNCQLCNAAFGFLTRRHHCRNCGKCVCESCSKEKCRVPRIDERALMKVCNECARELKKARNYGF